MTGSPSDTSDLLPGKLYVAELVMLPLFWLAPAMLAVVGGATYFDVHELEDEYGVEFGDSRYLWYVAPSVSSYLGSMGYKLNRLKAVRQHLGLSASEMGHLVGRLDAPKGYGVRILALLQMLLLVLFVLVPADLPIVLLLVAGAFGLTLLASPPAVWFDLRRVRQIEEIGWGWPGYLHVICSVVPFVVFVYALQRQQHLQYAVLVRVWDADLSEFSVPDEELSTLAKLGDRLDELAP